ncbi:hypothetical protein [Archangium lansingense]|uniref:Uncharacterized protein n=1 Tax=Archangium lansingense TaxID=2995310 RepID=A0ABT4A3N4_9BACT|nr:hypothetical protein [Archangium lansinium]MCY1076260.1 hypothetical protein [Archangium lansinium]
MHWEYTDFYMQEYLEQSVEGYEPWRETVQRILNEKTSRWAG